jgi:hypothetical protein
LKKKLHLIPKRDYNWTSTGGDDMSVAYKVFDAMVSELSEKGKSDLGKDVFQHLVAELELYGEVERYKELP